ncbi:MAG: hypothetical protein R3288_06330 [Woeseiaceae bacterium]|nr:hypothetical protein [Woeseiaceae bacterium]
MPDITVVHVGIATLATIVGVLAGWLVRARRCRQEKNAINAGWQEQIEAQRGEHGRLVAQNKSLMEQVNQFKSSGNEANNRSRELSSALKDALQQRDELQREIGSVRSNLEAAVRERRRLESDVRNLSAQDSSLSEALAAKDDKIARLTRELESWHERLPPLMERFRERNAEAERLELELAEAREQIHSLQSVLNSDETHVEALDPDDLSGELDASNDTVNSAPVNRLRDDLKQIKGIGPAIEKTLNELGIFRISQIAAMSEYDIDRVASRLKGFRSRIYRENWIGQARELQENASGDLY